MPESDHLIRIGERRHALRVWCAEHLGSGSRFVFEIGSGHGHFLTAYARAHPDRLCIGIDPMGERLARAERKRARAGMENLHFVRAGAEDFLCSLPASARFLAIYILFPDPWPKRRHQKHRLLQGPLLRELAARSPPDTRLYFRTDHWDYLTQARAQFAAEAAWRLVEEPWPFESPTVFQARQPAFRSLVAARTGLGGDKFAADPSPGN